MSSLSGLQSEAATFNIYAGRPRSINFIPIDYMGGLHNACSRFFVMLYLLVSVFWPPCL